MAKILVVDDEKMIASALQRVLAKSGHEVKTASNGLEAIQLLEGENFSLIFLDLLMPEMNGSDLMEWLRVHRPQAKYIVMTAYGDQAAKETIMQKGAQLILAKPFENILEIPKLVERLL